MNYVFPHRAWLCESIKIISLTYVYSLCAYLSQCNSDYFIYNITMIEYTESYRKTFFAVAKYSEVRVASPISLPEFHRGCLGYPREKNCFLVKLFPCLMHLNDLHHTHLINCIAVSITYICAVLILRIIWFHIVDYTFPIPFVNVIYVRNSKTS